MLTTSTTVVPASQLSCSLLTSTLYNGGHMILFMWINIQVVADLLCYTMYRLHNSTVLLHKLSALPNETWRLRYVFSNSSIYFSSFAVVYHRLLHMYIQFFRILLNNILGPRLQYKHNPFCILYSVTWLELLEFIRADLCRS
jgi:hypothetical protein